MISNKNKTTLELLHEHIKENPDHIAVIYDKEKITNAKLWELSGRVYAWLKSKRIGPENIVMYHLPRGIELYACYIGTLRAGAAFVLTETNNNQERTEFIRKDCNCKLFVDENCWNEILKTAPLEGYEPINLHNLCYIAYTSGTTGNPKGVLHEYGSLENAWKSFRMNNNPILCEADVFLFISPMNFVSFPIISSFACAFHCTIAILPYSCSQCDEQLNKYIYENGVNCGYLTPSFFRKHNHSIFHWKICLFSSEPANEIYIPNTQCYNVYASTESGCLVTLYRLTHSMDHAPIGKSQSDIEVTILDENGKEVTNGNVGEICYKNSFVRGYLNQPELNKKLIKNDIIHSGDMGKISDDGNILICGRLDAMFKVRGYRINPDDIAAAIKKVSALRNFIVKGFVYEDFSSICVFYTDKLKIDEAVIHKKLLEFLPEYMTPTNYIQLNEIPLLETIKADKLKLLSPSRSWEDLHEAASPNFILFEKGRTSSIYNFGKEKVLKLYNINFSFDKINNEKNLIKSTRSIGIPTPNIYEIVRSSDDGYGIIMDKINGLTLEKSIKAHPEKQKMMIKLFVDSIKSIHQIKVKNQIIPDKKVSFISCANQINSTFCSEKEKRKIISIFENIPDADTFLHGDCHTGNAIISSDNKIEYIDLMLCAKGHPIFDLLCMYSHYVYLPSFTSDEACVSSLGMTKLKAEELYDFFIKTYYSEKSNDEIIKIKEHIKGVHAASICVASVILPSVFSTEMLNEAKRRAILFTNNY